MPEKPVFLASDAHIGASPEAHERAFYAWLRHAAERASHIVLNGDVFDFWFEYRDGIPAGYDELLDTLREVVRHGPPVTLMGGNHDWWGGSYLREEIGVEFLQEPVVRTLGGKRTYLAHGDGEGPGDLGYRILSAILRNRLFRACYARLGPALGDRIGNRVSHTRERWDPDSANKMRAAALEEWAVELLVRDPGLDLVVFGHTHIPRLREVEPGRWYVNSGDWVANRTWVELEEGAPPRMRVWEPG